MTQLPSKYNNLPSEVQNIHRAEHVTEKSVLYTQSYSSGDAYGSYGIDQYFDLTEFNNNCIIDIISMDDSEVIFDIIGIEAPIANALRRIMLSELPTMAIETVVMFQNTSIVADEVLCHRLGLIPIAVDPRLFQYIDESNTSPKANERNTIVFTLNKTCRRNTSCNNPAAPDHEQYIDHIVYSRDLQWVPQGRQAEFFNAENNNLIKPVFDDIIIAKLRPGQQIECELRCDKNIGRVHAKYSPVGTASYRLLPEIIIHKPILNDEATQLKQSCPMNVFDIEDIVINKQQYKQATVARPRNCSMCRECIRSDKLWIKRDSNTITLHRIRNHFIFSVEAVGQYKAIDIVKESINVLQQKANKLKQDITKYKNNVMNGDNQDDILGSIESVAQSSNNIQDTTMEGNEQQQDDDLINNEELTMDDDDDVVDDADDDDADS